MISGDTGPETTHMLTRPIALTLLALGCFAALEPAHAQEVILEQFATGLDRPVFLTAPPGDLDRIFVVEQHTGSIRIVSTNDGSVLDTPFLTISGLPTGFEQGLLGLAFHPDYDNNGHFFVYYTDPHTQVVRYTVSGSPDIANPASALPILSITQPQNNHNGGWMGFGPDDYLYIATGDGGNRDDDGDGHTSGIGNAQDITNNLLGKILSIDIDADDFPAEAARNYAIPGDNPFVGKTGDDEIWAYGLRNPWRASFDRETGDLWIADVGQDYCEEIDVQPAESNGGENYGWRLREGMIATPTGGVGGASPAGAVDPIMEYTHPGQLCGPQGSLVDGISITGGYVYRGPAAPLRGRYFFSDFSTARVWSLVWDETDPVSNDGTNFSDFIDHADDPEYGPDVGTLSFVSSFGEDAAGNLYVLDLFGGEVFLVPEPSLATLQLAGIATLAALVRVRARSRRFVTQRGAWFPS